MRYRGVFLVKFLMLVLLAGLLPGCGGCVDWGDWEGWELRPVCNDDSGVFCEPTTPCEELIGRKDFSKALRVGRVLVESEPDNADGHYCIALANVGSLFSSVNSIVGLVSSLGAPQNGVQPSAQDLKSLVGSFFEPIQASMREFDQAAYVLAGMDKPTWQIESFPLPLDVEAMLGLLGDDAPIMEGNASLNLGGTWSLAEIHLLAAAFNGVQGLLDYLMAHELVVSKLELPEFSTEGLAGFLVKNPDLLTLASNPEDQARLTGNDVRKGVRNAVLSLLSYLVGRSTHLERVALANDGLLEAIRASAALGATDAVVAWSVDEDGYPTGFRIRMIDALNKQVSFTTVDGEPIEIASRYDIAADPAFWNSLLTFGEELRDNMETGGAAVAVKPVVDAIVDVYGEEIARWGMGRLLGREFPDLVYLNPRAFFEDPWLIRDMLPNYFGYVSEPGAAIRYDLGVERETYGDGVTMAVERLGRRTETTEDTWHFAYDDAVGYQVESIDTLGQWYESLPPDELAPSPTSPLLTYISLQSPSFGGALEVRFEGEEAAAPPDSYAFNHALNGLVGYYCLDFLNLGFGEALDENSYAQPCE